MHSLSQIIAVTSVTLRSIGQRLGSSFVAIIGIAGVVIVFTAVLSIAEGFRAAMSERGDPLRVLILRSGADTEMTSGLGGDDVRTIMDAPGIEVTPIQDMTTNRHFCEVTFDDVRVPKKNLVGQLNGSWRQTMGQLEHERGGIRASGQA